MSSFGCVSCILPLSATAELVSARRRPHISYHYFQRLLVGAIIATRPRHLALQAAQCNEPNHRCLVFDGLFGFGNPKGFAQ